MKSKAADLLLRLQINPHLSKISRIACVYQAPLFKRDKQILNIKILPDSKSSALQAPNQNLNSTWNYWRKKNKRWGITIDINSLRTKPIWSKFRLLCLLWVTLTELITNSFTSSAGCRDKTLKCYPSISIVVLWWVIKEIVTKLVRNNSMADVQCVAFQTRLCTHLSIRHKGG